MGKKQAAKLLAKIVAYRTGLTIFESRILANIIIRDLPKFLLDVGELPIPPYGRFYVADGVFKFKPSQNYQKKTIREQIKNGKRGQKVRQDSAN